MKCHAKAVLLAALAAGCLCAKAQTGALPLNIPDYNKPKIFSDLPEKTPIQLKGAESLLDLPVGATVNTPLGVGFRLTGTVVSKSDPTDVLVQSVVIKSPSRGNAVFSFSRIKTADGNITYAGRMFGRTAGDVLEIVKDGDAFVFRKKGYYDLLNE